MQMGISSTRKAGAVIKTSYRLLSADLCQVVLHALSHFFTTTLGGRCCYALHFTDKDTEAQKGEVTCLRLQS